MNTIGGSWQRTAAGDLWLSRHRPSLLMRLLEYQLQVELVAVDQVLGISDELQRT